MNHRGRRLRMAVISSFALMAPLIAAGPAMAQEEQFDRTVLPILPAPFEGTIAETPEDSDARFRAEVQAPEGAPNIILVMTDDVGFGASSTFGGLIPTPALDALAEQGLRYNNFHTTAMCSPSRAALLTGRNHHAVGMGTLSDYAEGYPGYDARIPKSAATIAEVLGQNGYTTGFFGKHHNVPKSENSIAGPFDHWPTGLGFDYFFGFMGSQTDQWNPGLTRGISRVEAEGEGPLDRMLISDAVQWVHNIKAAKPDKPFFLYLAPGTAHAPLQAPPEWIARFKGKFDAGWEAARDEIFTRQKAAGIIPQDTQLAPRPPFIPAWDSLSSAEKQVEARLMEVYAAQLAFQDHQFGRLMAELKRSGQYDNTLVVFIEGDNGASAEGGQFGTTNDFGRLVNRPPESMDWLAQQLDVLGSEAAHAHYPVGWAWATSTPFPMFKRFASHLGGQQNGMVVAWPGQITVSGEIRRQFAHLIDLYPTILEAAGIPVPVRVNGVDQQKLDGVSLVSTFGKSEPVGPHRVQYFEMLGNRALYQDGWLASTLPPESVISEAVGGQVGTGTRIAAVDYEWQLFDLSADFSQSRDLAEAHPERLAAMRQLWDEEAQRNNVYPINANIPPSRGKADVIAHAPARTRYDYWGVDTLATLGTDPPILSESHRLTASLTTSSDNASGVIMAYGNRFAGWSLYLKDGHLTLHQAFSDQPAHNYVLRASVPLSAGSHELGYSVSYNENGSAGVMLFDGDRQLGTAEFPHHINRVDQTETFDIGRDSGGKVVEEYDNGGIFPGTISHVTVDLTSP